MLRLITRKPIASVSLVFALMAVVPLSAFAQYPKLDSIRQATRQLPNDTTKVIKYMQVFVAALRMNPDSAFSVAWEQLKLAEQLNHERGIGLVYKELCVAYQASGNMKKAIEYGLKSNRIFEKRGELNSTLANYNNIALIYQAQNNLPEAMKHFQKSLQGYQRLNDTVAIYNVKLNVGTIYQKQRKFALAEQYFMDALALIRKKQKHSVGQVGKVYYNLGSLYVDKEEYATAQKYLEDALEVIGKAPEAVVTSQIYPLLARIYKARNERTKALEMAKRGLEVTQASNFRPMKSENYLQVAEAYASLEQYKEAYPYLKSYARLKDSLAGKESVQKVERLQYAYDLEKKEAANQALLKDRKIRDTEIGLQKAAIERKNAINAAVGVALVAFILLFVIYYRSAKARKKANALLHSQQREIMDQNHEIMAQNEEISRQKEHLHHLNNTKNKLFSIISHDLRAPVSTLQQALTLFTSELITKEEITDMSDQMLTDVVRTSVMMDNLLHWAKSQMDGIRLKKEALHLSPLVHTVLHNHQKQAEQKGIRLVDDCHTPPDIFADGPAMELVLRNLLSNAIKFCKAGDSITVSCKRHDRFLHVSVTDTGCGMDAATVGSLFDEGNHHTTSGTANEKGTGLGLRLCLDFVAMNGGELWVKSEPQQGSTFTFSMPLAAQVVESADGHTAELKG